MEETKRYTGFRDGSIVRVKFWQKPEPVEVRQSGAGFQDAVVRAIELAATTGVADASSSAALEAASGSMSRAFMSARVEGPEWARRAINPRVLALIGRDLVRRGQSMHEIMVNPMGDVKLLPVANWHFTGWSSDPDSWIVRSTTYGPSNSLTSLLPYAGVVFVQWGTSAALPYVGVGPTTWAAATNKMLTEVERSLGDEAGGPITQLLPNPMSPDPDDDDDPLKDLAAAIAAARGRALIVESTSTGYGEGRTAGTQRDNVPHRLGPNPPATMPEISRLAFAQMLAACGAVPGMHLGDADGTNRRESARQFFMMCVRPYADLLQWELSEKLETPIELVFDELNYFRDVVGRSQAYRNMKGNGMDNDDAMAEAGLGE